jgi:predicted RNase H-like nuclease (RuvC/YqgF family)
MPEIHQRRGAADRGEHRQAAGVAICCLRREIENKEGAVGRLELLLHERLTKIDELNAKLEQSREQVRRLGLENEILTAMIAAPPLYASMLAAK